MHKVVLGALVREGRVLLVHRRPNKRAYPGVWDLPGGVIEAGESELGALTRELHEELGVQIATGLASHLCRLTAGPAEEPALFSAWLVRDW
jgi:8-oxo-dGTP pyrophosphatase MutT (NUDIX family)